MKDTIFIILALLTVGSAVFVTFGKNIVYSAFTLLLTLATMAGLYIMLGADFLAGVQLLLYVGGILVLIIFAVMMTRGIEKTDSTNRSRTPFIAIAICLAFLALWMHGIWRTPWVTKTGFYEATTSMMGNALLTKYLLPFEVISILLLVGLIGAITVLRLTHKNTSDKNE